MSGSFSSHVCARLVYWHYQAPTVPAACQERASLHHHCPALGTRSSEFTVYSEVCPGGGPLLVVSTSVFSSDLIICAVL